MPTQQDTDIDTIAVLAEIVPVEMPNLPPKLLINTPQQFKALGDTLRWRILGIIQNQPATAKQIADRLKVPPGTIGHHLQVLEETGLAKVVARRLVRGIVAKTVGEVGVPYVIQFRGLGNGNSTVIVSKKNGYAFIAELGLR